MKGLISVIKRYFAFGVLILILFFLLWLKLISKDSPQDTFPQPGIPIVPTIIKIEAPKISQSPLIVSEGSINYVYTGNTFTPPNEIRVYSPKNYSLSSVSDTSFLTSSFNITSPPTITDSDRDNNKFYLWNQDNKVLSIGGNPPFVHYNNYDFLAFTDQVGNFNKNSIVTISKEIIEKLGNKLVDYNNPSFVYYKTITTEDSGIETPEIELVEVNSENEASYIGVGFNYLLGGFPTFTDVATKYPVYLIFNMDENLFELTTRIINLSATDKAVKVKPFNEVLNDLNTKAIVFDASTINNVNELGYDLYKINVVDLNQVDISYYLPSDNINSFFPYYRFKGFGTDKNTGNTVDVVVIIPVSDNF